MSQGLHLKAGTNIDEIQAALFFQSDFPVSTQKNQIHNTVLQLLTGTFTSLPLPATSNLLLQPL